MKVDRVQPDTGNIVLVVVLVSRRGERRNRHFARADASTPDQVLATRRKLLDMVAADRLPITGYYPFPAGGYSAKLGNGYDFVPASWGGEGADVSRTSSDQRFPIASFW